MTFKCDLTRGGNLILRDAECDDKEDFLMVIPKESIGQLINELAVVSPNRQHLLCLDGFKTADDFKSALLRMRPDWFEKQSVSTVPK